MQELHYLLQPKGNLLSIEEKQMKMKQIHTGIQETLRTEQQPFKVCFSFHFVNRPFFYKENQFCLSII